MNEKLEEALAKLIQNINDGTELAAEQIPDVLAQFIQWQALVYGFWLGVSGILLIACIAGLVRIIKNPDLDISNHQDSSALLLFSGFTAIIGIVFGYLSFLLIKIIFFSKLYIVQYAADYIAN